ncbi:MAG TPA: hypothetical protein VMF58_12305 [Rhizomicrobium sp.]|nr:hypothetical protein [Rhizomicrobium sp.]
MRIFEIFTRSRGKRHRIRLLDVFVFATAVPIFLLLPESVWLAFIAAVAVHLLALYVKFRWRQIRALNERDA